MTAKWMDTSPIGEEDQVKAVFVETDNAGFVVLITRDPDGSGQRHSMSPEDAEHIGHLLIQRAFDARKIRLERQTQRRKELEDRLAVLQAELIRCQDELNKQITVPA